MYWRCTGLMGVSLVIRCLVRDDRNVYWGEKQKNTQQKLQGKTRKQHNNMNLEQNRLDITYLCNFLFPHR
ncbi:hypothetical protein XELAEV_18039862mg [Xenopus laevis]|uniref:Uncharacterized protein n=1 Tax=Xenopus laevis TaxID=8355 RepID=A0A974C8D3_XENLA|nr:hypothetical protein XELAEV_18039862mg [Xenopus laevis]